MVITLLSDFRDVYPASMKGVILNINPQATIVDISHSVPRYDVQAGAFMLMISARYFPTETVHIAVVDPGVGTQRRIIAIKADSPDYGTHYFVGPDNGLLIPAARSVGEFKVYEITNKALFRKEISHTFHGRDIFAPVGAHISKEMDIGSIGKQIYDFVDMDLREGQRTDGSLEGLAIFIDQFGNIVTNISYKIVDLKPGDILEFQKKKVIFQSSYGLCKVNEALILIGSHGYLEIAINKGNAACYFNIKSGDRLIITLG